MGEADSSARRAEPVVFGTAFEGLVRAMGDKLDLQAREQFRALGVELDRPFAAAYTIECWTQAVALASRTSFPGLPPEEADLRLGRAWVTGFERTLVGKATLAAARVIGLKRMMARLTSALKTSSNYIESSFSEEPRGYLIEVRTMESMLPRVKQDPGTSPQYLQGILQECCAVIGEDQVKVELLSYDLDTRTARYLLRVPQR